MVLEFFTDPKSIPHDLHHIINEQMISAYFAALTQVLLDFLVFYFFYFCVLV